MTASRPTNARHDRLVFNSATIFFQETVSRKTVKPNARVIAGVMAVLQLKGPEVRVFACVL
jgi:hypothetical protein